MKTLSSIPLLKADYHRNYVILLEDLEFAISKKQLERIAFKHNQGMSLEEITESERRDPYEVILALLHLTRSNKRHIRPFAFRRTADDSETGQG